LFFLDGGIYKVSWFLIYMKYEFLPHTADLKFRAYGKTLNEAFENVVLAFAEIIGKGKKVRGRVKKNIEVFGSDRKNLLYSFLDELIYLLDANGFVVSRGELKVVGNRLKGILWGDEAGKYKDLDHVKAATYAEMVVRRSAGGWVLQAVVDV
jgi:SHS2 domain-containing protein